MIGFPACHIGSFVLGRIPVFLVCCTLLAGALGLSLVRRMLHLNLPGHLVVALVLPSYLVVVLHVQLVLLLLDHLVA